ncbi:MAG: hypothetical protein WDO15_14525 [Bacteroidota bacterium]
MSLTITRAPAQQVAVYNNNLTASNNSTVSGNWNDMYLYIYEANSIIEGAAASPGLIEGSKGSGDRRGKILSCILLFLSDQFVWRCSIGNIDGLSH